MRKITTSFLIAILIFAASSLAQGETQQPKLGQIWKNNVTFVSGSSSLILPASVNIARKNVTMSGNQEKSLANVRLVTNLSLVLPPRFSMASANIAHALAFTNLSARIALGKITLAGGAGKRAKIYSCGNPLNMENGASRYSPAMTGLAKTAECAEELSTPTMFLHSPSSQNTDLISGTEPHFVPDATQTPIVTLGSKLLELGIQQIGKPYSYGAAGPNSFDCSGLIQWLYLQITNGTILVPHNDSSQYAFWTQHPELCTVLSREEIGGPENLQPGDLVFKMGFGHEMVVVDSTTYLHAPHSGAVVSMAPLDWNNSSRFGRFVRLKYPPGQEPVPPPPPPPPTTPGWIRNVLRPCDNISKPDRSKNDNRTRCYLSSYVSTWNLRATAGQ